MPPSLSSLCNRMWIGKAHLGPHYGNAAIVRMGTVLALGDYAASRSQLLSFAEFGARAETDSLLFDLSYFKAKTESIISNEAQLILSSPPQNRTSEGVKMAMLSLRATVDTFATYPVLIQQELARVGWYECFGPGRVIIRQGHIPQNFYLILSGTTVVTKVSVNKQTGELFPKTVAFLKKGKYFGDVAILTSTKRNATVVCHDNVSLLAVSREDFLGIFLNNESREGPDFMKFLHKIHIFSGWPIEKLPYSNPRICVHTFFKPGTVITKDSKASSKIYVIKTGTVRVLKAMTPSKPHLPFKYFKFSTLHQGAFVKEDCTEQSLKQPATPMLYGFLRAGDSAWRTGWFEHRRKMMARDVRCNAVALFRHAGDSAWRTGWFEHRRKMMARDVRCNAVALFRLIALRLAGITGHSERYVAVCKMPKHLSINKNCDRKESIADNRQMQSGNKENMNSRSFSEEYLLPILQRDTSSKDLLHHPTSTNNSNVGSSKPTGTDRISEEDETSQIYIHIQTLRAGDVFGLAYAVFDDTLSMALVSDGAECIMISKEFFKKNMDDVYFAKLSTTVQPYPSKEMLQLKMQDYMNWKAYKRLLINSPY
ncbi:uncharacterized protein [Ambystoma mexicanum]|uniref:uncharacterized protein n=1 Tax=Ambystoma mexicanum TaxID=8296 RepID=UPI0037E95516